MTVLAYTTALDGTGRVPLDALGTVSSLSYTSAVPGGDTTCALSLGLAVNANPWALTVGRRLEVRDGPGRVWSGILGDPQRGTPWQVSGTGLSALAADYLALDASGNLTTNPNTAVDQAIIRGLPWVRTATLPTPTVTASGSDVGSLLDAVAAASGDSWTVGADGTVSMLSVAAPTTADYILDASSTPGGRTIDGFATDLWAKYQPPVTVSGAGTIAGAPALIAADKNPASTASRPFGRREAIYDTTPGGPITSANAQIMADGVLALVQPRANFTGSLPVVPGALLTPGGMPARLAQVRAGQVVRLVGVSPDPTLGELTFSTSFPIVIGAWAYDAIADAAVLTPLGAKSRDLGSLLTLAAAAASSAQRSPVSQTVAPPMSGPILSGPPVPGAYTQIRSGPPVPPGY